MRECFPVGNKEEPWHCSCAALCSSSGSSIAASLLLKVVGAMQGGAGGGSCCTCSREGQKQRDAVRCHSQRGAKHPGPMPGQQDTAEMAHLDQDQGLCTAPRK